MSDQEPRFSDLGASCVQHLLDLEIQKIIDADTQKPKAIYSLFNQAIAANTNFITTPLIAQKTPCIFRIYVALSAAGIFSIQRTIAGITAVEYMNQGVALAANSAYMFDIIVDNQSEGIDFQTTVAATILKLSVVEKDDVK